LSALDHVLAAVEPPTVPRSTKRTPLDLSDEAVDARILEHARKLAVSPTPEVEDARPSFTLLSADDLRTLPAHEWAVRPVLPRHGVGCIYGASGTGKSFFGIDLLAAVAEGCDWFGYRVKKPLRVVIVSLEGQAGVPLRVKAWEVARGRPFPATARFVLDRLNLTDRQSVLELCGAIDAGGGADMILIDTLNRAAPEADENASRDMGMVLEGCKDLQAMTDSMVLLVSHTGKDATKGLRGHSSLYAALDAAIEVSRDANGREWKVAKAKDGEDGKTHRFRLEVVELGEDDEGQPVTSCVVQPDMTESAISRPRPPKGGNQKLIYDALCPLFRESAEFGKAGAPSHRPCINLEDAVRLTRDRLTVPTERRTERTRQAITGLVSSGVMGCNEGWIWLI
jgi:putative DNA primase/helicase